MPVTTIIERSAAYRQAGIALVWVTSADVLAALNNQAFCDLYLASGGRIFAVDAASYARSEETSVFHLRELSLEPCIQHPFAIYNRWRSRMVGPEVILMPEAQRHAEGQRTYAAVLAEKLQATAPGLMEKIGNAVGTGTDHQPDGGRMEHAGQAGGRAWPPTTSMPWTTTCSQASIWSGGS